MYFSHHQKRSYGVQGACRAPLPLTSRWMPQPVSILALYIPKKGALRLFREDADFQLNSNNLWPLPMRKTAPVTYEICPLHPVCDPSVQISFSEGRVVMRSTNSGQNHKKPLYLLIGNMKHVFYYKDSAIHLIKKWRKRKKTMAWTSVKEVVQQRTCSWNCHWMLQFFISGE